MRTVNMSLMGLALTALIAGPASAQGPGRGAGARMGSYSGLLNNESVQKELKLDDKQVEKAKELEEKINEERREKFQDLQGLEGQERFAKMQAIGHELNATALKQAGEFLKPDQINRLKQISYRQRGAQAFHDPEVAAKLKITDAQKSEIQEVSRESWGKMPSREDFQNDREAAMKKMLEINKETRDKIESKLNDEQRKTWKAMLGEPFEIKFEQN